MNNSKSKSKLDFLFYLDCMVWLYLQNQSRFVWEYAFFYIVFVSGDGVVATLMTCQSLYYIWNRVLFQCMTHKLWVTHAIDELSSKLSSYSVLWSDISDDIMVDSEPNRLWRWFEWCRWLVDRRFSRDFDPDDPDPVERGGGGGTNSKIIILVGHVMGWE